MKVDARDPLRHEEQLRVGTVQQRQEVLAQRLFVAKAVHALTAGCGVGRNHPPACRDVDAAELVAERRRRLRQQERMSTAERLQVGSVGECGLDLHEHLARSGLRIGDGLDAKVTGRVEPGSPHGVNTTFSASRRRNRSSPSAKRSSGSTTGSGTSSCGRSAAASRIASDVAEREPTTVSSRR